MSGNQFPDSILEQGEKHQWVEIDSSFLKKISTKPFAYRMSYFLDTLSQEPISLYSKGTNKVLAKASTGIYHYFDLNSGQYFSDRKGKAKFEQKHFEVNGYLWSEMDRLDLAIPERKTLESIIGVYFDIWNKKLDGTISITNQIKSNFNQIIHLEFDLAGLKEKLYYFHTDDFSGYVTKHGFPIDLGLLKAPIKYGIISSHYDLNRIHPITKKRKPHLGTDYAAPEGDPLYSIGNGEIIECEYTRNNGRYIKIQHSNSYQSQYLHMKEFAPGLKVGSKVDKGQVIGRVGSTGLATDPHVCFRFRSKGKQIDHRFIKVPKKNLLNDSLTKEFNNHTSEIDKLVQNIK